MAIAAVELMGFFLGILGLIGNLVATLLPYWEVSAHIGQNIVTAVTNMKGLWMACVHQSTGVFQCETFSTSLGLSTELQAARAMMVFSVIFSALACAVSSVGMQCTTCMDGFSGTKAKAAGAGGCLFFIAGLLSLIPISWQTHEVVQTFYQYTEHDGLKFEIGDCLFVGFASSIVSLLGGGLLSMSCCSYKDVQRRFRRHAGGYPYPERVGKHGTGRGASRWTPFRPSATLQSGINMNPTNRTQTMESHYSSSSSQSTTGVQDATKPAHRKPAASYEVTGYV
ncbi:claudin-2 [Ictalurus furcatus]|uniref:claudin-2 n=1 Tax=Ictalurus furcatus TaxID=66913 RepID=UPI00234FBBCF|nr:claudin-2 [Ictalurus furcatus]XP_053504543.1 claudin-2 [Ictalurus furcatus]XP_053504544.1 claudin-2 [Ictalurus furcatus]XP_053504545.1 claudin-2 [Ictalurus furcatus]XP_053504546.1 claudin-2 [Ictalurus furcatus]XP_053504549.1 claudin-2 [Ictalurus furcatus]XP_053504550.1 claudin-2 [Ictalurus furcatus]XP_053504551.1 claudin-2 [Ictalurus furcatus]XP_053504552.1 claudin-2 [Ictalurus furcatus]